MKILYKTDSKKKLRVWWAEADNDAIHVHHGIENGSIITESTTCLPKNIGRSNATTGAQQAQLELQALYKKKQDRDGYTTSPAAVVNYLQPMLARDYSKVGHQVDWQKKTYGSAKMDGVRAIWVQGKGFQSRKGTFYRVPHLENALSKVSTKLDGELYIHGQPLNRIVAAVKKPNPLTTKIEFRVFDALVDGDFDTRFDHLCAEVSRIHNKQVIIVPHLVLHNESRMKHYHQEFVTQGYEGIMIRQNGPYLQGQRSDSLYKYKEFEEAEFEIIGIKPDKHGQAVLQCEGFDVRMRGTDQERKEQLENPSDYIGKLVTVRYFTLTEYGKPQFPVGITIREDL